MSSGLVSAFRAECIALLLAAGATLGACQALTTADSGPRASPAATVGRIRGCQSRHCHG